MANFNTGSTQTRTSGVSTSGLLLVLFIALKLTGVIAWSWWWVLAPLWIPFAILLVFGLIALVVFFTIDVVETSRSRARKRKIK